MLNLSMPQCEFFLSGVAHKRHFRLATWTEAVFSGSVTVWCKLCTVI